MKYTSRLKKNGLTFWIIGFLAFIWVLVRSGVHPRRLTYPCQQAAFPLASAWLIASLSMLGGLLITRPMRKYSGMAFFILFIGILMISSTWKGVNIDSDVDLPNWEVSSPVSKIFVMNAIPATSGSLAAGNATVPNASLVDPAMDTLFQIMATQELYLCKTSSHPAGIIDTGDIVIIKGNFQWDYRLGTHTDRIKGLIWRILNHPDGFRGEILVCDNTQQYSEIDENKNNSEDENQSIIDVVNTFEAKGYPVHLVHWKSFRETEVQEYPAGDTTDGYIYESSTKISYPKFQSPEGAYISLRYGIWNNNTSTYNKDKLCIINFPVVKAHGMAGATLGIKNWIGVLTTADNVNRYGGWDTMHDNYFWGDYALVARVMEVTFPDLTILDGTWTSGNLNYQFDASYNFHTRCLIASTDPLASSWYAAKYVLNPVAKNKDNTDPDNTGGNYGNALQKWAAYLIDSAQLAVTMDSSKISVYDRSSLEAMTRVKDKIEYHDIRVYPNPSKESVTLSVPNIIVDRIEMVDARGVVYAPKYRKIATEIHLDLTGYPVGAYHIIILSQGRELSRSFIKH